MFTNGTCSWHGGEYPQSRMATTTSRPPVRDIRNTVNPPRGFDQSAMLTSYRVWDYSLKPKKCQNGNLVITSGTAGCCSDNLSCHHGQVDNKGHDDIIKWKHFLRYWPFVQGIHQSPVNFPHKGQWGGHLCLNKRLRHSWNWWVETPTRSLWCHCNAFWQCSIFNVVCGWWVELSSKWRIYAPVS